MSSARLPGKALKEIGKYPVFLLAAARVHSNSMPVTILTSDRAEDDIIVSISRKYGLNTFRGDLDNVLKRFYDAASGLNEDDLIVRLTGDNLVPDRDFVSDVVNVFRGNSADIVVTSQEQLPYGLSAEVFSVKKLRDAFFNAHTKFDQEHVTSWIRQNARVMIYENPKFAKFAHLRCTIDNEFDYQVIKNALAGYDPLQMPSEEMCLRIQNLPDSASFSIRNQMPGLTLGTAQFGQRYGITNKVGKPTFQAVKDALVFAFRYGIKDLDTARAYGDSEKNIGDSIFESGLNGAFHITTKLMPFSGNLSLYSNLQVFDEIQSSVEVSLKNLRLNKLDSLMIHRAEYLKYKDGLVLRELLKLQHEGKIEKIGVSVQSPEELNLALAFPEITHIQLPINILDHRWNACLERLPIGIRIDVRSVFLQGMLLNPDAWIKVFPESKEAKAVKDWLEAQPKRLKEASLIHLCLNFVRGIPSVRQLVCGVDSIEHLKEILVVFRSDPLGAEKQRLIKQDRPILSESYLNPANWPRRKDEE